MKNFLKSEKTSPWLALIISFLVMILVIQILSWQYNRIAKEEIFNLEERVEQAEARSRLKDFLEARIDGNESQAKILLTERAMEKVFNGEVQLIDDMESYEILEDKRTEEGGFSFLVKIRHGDGTESLELIKATKIMERYYIDSVKLPG